MVPAHNSRQAGWPVHTSANLSVAAAKRQKEAATMADAATPEQLAELFKAFDPTNSGTLTAEGLQAVMRTQ